MRLAVVLSAMLLCSFAGRAETIYVPDQFQKIQWAINYASNGDTIIVRAGTYDEIIDFIGKSIEVRSEDGPAATVIDGNQTVNMPVVTFQSGEPSGAILEGFTITNGDGGVWCRPESYSTIRGNVIVSNLDSGVNCGYSSTMITENTITDNKNGGIRCYSSSAVISDNIIKGNTARFFGGGIGCHDFEHNRSLTIENNIISGNKVVLGNGGGVEAYGCSLKIEGNVISDNEANEFGGGLSFYASSFLMLDNVIRDNRAGLDGGAVCCADSLGDFVNNTIIHNKSGRSGGGLFLYPLSLIMIVNTILWNNEAPQGPEASLENDSILSISYSVVKAGQQSVIVDTGAFLGWGLGMITQDPMLVDASAGDVHLTYPSPCRDSGMNFYYWNWERSDFEGDPRKTEDFVDIGADEFHPHLYHLGDVVPGGTVDIRVIGPPGTPNVTLCGAAAVQDLPQWTQYGYLCLEWPIRKLSLGTIPSSGCLTFSRSAPGWWRPGDIYMFQALIGPEGHPDSILSNLDIIEVK